jgi:hypothetical protein
VIYQFKSGEGMTLKIKKTKSGFEIKKTDKKPSNPKGWQDSYDITCPQCGHEQQTRPSLFHYMGCYDAGFGDCSKCLATLSIQFQPATNTMLAVNPQKE